jgi:hypothetical protein
VERIAVLVIALALAGPAGAVERATAPGAADSRVTQDNVQTTICRRGYTASIRPPAKAAHTIKLRLFRQQHLDGVLSDYTLDHLIALEIGGHPTAVGNLWLQPVRESLAKDADERRLHRAVCAGRMTLVAAQAEMIGKWGPDALQCTN